MSEPERTNPTNSQLRRKLIAGGLILLGLSLILAALYFVLTPTAGMGAGGLLKTSGEIFVFLLGAGANVRGWLDLFKKDGGGNRNQYNIGDGNTNIQADTVYVQPPTPKEPETHDTIGFIPPAGVVRYIPRGDIEHDVRDFLKNGGVGAIVGLHAPGGLGKTELAKHAAEELKSEFEQVLWVDVGEHDAPQVVRDMLIACAVQTRPGAGYEEQRNELRAYLRQHRYLVVLDDVRKNALEKLDDLLPPKPCTTLLTSRVRQIGGVNKTFGLDPMTPAQARELLVAVLGEDVVKAEEQAAADLAERCAFNPLAVEIAARRIRQMQGVKKPIARYFEKAQAHFALLKMPGDQRWNMNYIFDLSYNDLSPGDQERFRALAAFHPTGFAPQAAAFLWESDETETQNTLSRFINLSLVKWVPAETEKIERYRLHDLLDEYSQGKLPRAEEKTARDKLALWIVALFSTYFTADRTTAPQVFIERANLLRSCEWARGQKNGELLARLVTQSRNWFYVNFSEDWHFWIAWLEASLQLGFDDSSEAGKQLRANVLQAIGDVQQFRKEMDAALKSYEQALQLFRQVGDKLGEANVLQAIGDVQQFRKEMDAALKSYEQALQLFRQVGAKLGEANVYLSLGDVKKNDHEYESAMVDFQNALETYQAIGDQYSQGRALYRLGDCVFNQKKYQDALKYYESAAQLWNTIRVTDLVESILAPRIQAAKEGLSKP